MPGNRCSKWPWLWVVALSTIAFAGETERSEISFEGKTYTYTFVSRIRGTLAAIHDVVTDYDHLQRLNDDIVESRVIERYSATRLKRLLQIDYCVLVFCFELIFVENVDESPTRIVTTIIPAESSFEDGIADWRLEQISETHTRFSVTTTQTPKFWIPPVIGPLMMKRFFLKEALETSDRIELIVNGGTL